MGKSKEIFFKRLLLFIVVFFVVSVNAYASSNTISGIDVQQMSNNGYQIFLKVDKNPIIKKFIDSEGNLSVILNKTLPSDSIEINYDNMPDIQNIIVQKKNTNSIISLQGQNISNSQIFVKDLSTGTIKQVNDKNISIFDNKFVSFALAAILILFLCVFTNRPKQQENAQVHKTKEQKTRRKVKANTLRNKNLTQTGTLPSINYAVNGSFGSASYYMTRPQGFVSGNEIDEEEIRKVG